MTILAPYEQAQPPEYPGRRAGDATGAMSLFDLRVDPGERRDVAAEHRDVAGRLKAHYDRVVGEYPAGSPDRSTPATPWAMDVSASNLGAGELQPVCHHQAEESPNPNAGAWSVRSQGRTSLDLLVRFPPRRTTQ
jgi:hypothetical protein